MNGMQMQGPNIIQAIMEKLRASQAGGMMGRPPIDLDPEKMAELVALMQRFGGGGDGPPGPGPGGPGPVSPEAVAAAHSRGMAGMTANLRPNVPDPRMAGGGHPRAGGPGMGPRRQPMQVEPARVPNPRPPQDAQIREILEYLLRGGKGMAEDLPGQAMGMGRKAAGGIKGLFGPR